MSNIEINSKFRCGHGVTVLHDDTEKFLEIVTNRDCPACDGSLKEQIGQHFVDRVLTPS